MLHPLVNSSANLCLRKFTSSFKTHPKHLFSTVSAGPQQSDVNSSSPAQSKHLVCSLPEMCLSSCLKQTKSPRKNVNFLKVSFPRFPSSWLQGVTKEMLVQVIEEDFQKSSLKVAQTPVLIFFSLFWFLHPSLFRYLKCVYWSSSCHFIALIM